MIIVYNGGENDPVGASFFAFAKRHSRAVTRAQQTTKPLSCHGYLCLGKAAYIY
jgi:hypothetical protein